MMTVEAKASAVILLLRAKDENSSKFSNIFRGMA